MQADGSDGDGDAVTWIGVAVSIPEPWGGQLTRRRAAAGDPLAAYMPAHLTLVGPTAVPAANLPDIAQHLARVARGHRPYVLALRGTGSFRPVTEVVFVAVAAGVGETERLAADVAAVPQLRRQSTYPYHPHVTVAHDVPGAALDAVHADLAGFSAQFQVAGFTLFGHAGDGHWLPYRTFPLGG